MRLFPHLKISFQLNLFFHIFFPGKCQTICLGIRLVIQKRFLAIQLFLVLCIYLYSFLMAEQLKCTSIVFREGGYMKIKCWRPSLSLLRKDLFKNNICDYMLTFILYLYKTYLYLKKADFCSHSKSMIFPLTFTIFEEFWLSTKIVLAASWFHAQFMQSYLTAPSCRTLATLALIDWSPKILHRFLCWL